MPSLSWLGMGDRRMWRAVLASTSFCLFSVVVLIPVIQPFLRPGSPATYDGFLHLFRQAAFHTALLEKNFPPYWSGYLAFGYGSPVIGFYWTLPYWMNELYLALGSTLSAAQNYTIITSVILSYVSMFLLLIRWFGWWPALAGAVLYVWSPFRFYILYDFGSTGTDVFFALLPLVFIAIDGLDSVRWRRFLWLGSIVVTLLMLAHHVLFAMCVTLITAYALARWHTAKTLPYLVRFACMTGIGLGASAYFWLPTLAEKYYLRLDSVWLGWFRTNFVTLRQLLSHPWFFPYTGQIWWQYIYGIGWPQLAAGLGGILYIVLGTVRKKEPYRKPDHSRTHPVFAVFFVTGLFMALPVSGWLWERSVFLDEFQAPIRFFTLSVFCSSVLLSVWIGSWKKYARWVSLGAIAVCLFLNYPYVARHLAPDAPRRNDADWWYRTGDSTTDSAGEFLPVWTDTTALYGPLRGDNRIVRVLPQDGAARDIEKTGTGISFGLTLVRAATVTLDQLYFPGWLAWANGATIPIHIDSAGRMTLRLEAGTYDIRTQFGDTPIRALGKLISAVCMLSIMILGLYAAGLFSRFRKQPRKK